MFNKTVKLKDVIVKTFNLNDSKQRKDYAKMMEDVFLGVQARTHVILYHDRQFVTCGDKPRWMVHIEWAEFVLDVKANPTTDGAPK